MEPLDRPSTVTHDLRGEVDWAGLLEGRKPEEFVGPAPFSPSRAEPRRIGPRCACVHLGLTGPSQVKGRRSLRWIDNRCD